MQAERARINQAIPRPQVNRAIVAQPHPQKLYFAGEFINMHHLAIRMKISVGAMSLIFSGKRNPCIPLAKKMAREFGLDVWDFYRLLEEYVEIRREEQAGNLGCQITPL
jgi:transcriptional regulator with XRE-family HTH domain